MPVTLGCMSELTRLLVAASQGDRQAAADLLPLVYAELRKLAAAKMAQEHPGHTLDATALVHEAYLRLVRSGEAPAAREPQYENRGHFFAAAAEAMRRILVDAARRKAAQRHGGNHQRVDLPDVAAGEKPDRLLALDEALTRLAVEDLLAAKVVELRHFAGLGHDAIAHTLSITVYQARQKWTYARAWLRLALKDE
jgi:RNA polymerase sigma factor (TIGR02999 family)